MENHKPPVLEEDGCLTVIKSRAQLSIALLILLHASLLSASDDKTEAEKHFTLKVLPLLVPFFKLSAWLRIKFARKGEPA